MKSTVRLLHSSILVFSLLAACAPEPAEPETFRMEPETAIDMAGTIVDVATDRRGWIFAADSASKSVRLFAPDGRQIREFGDFADISALTVDSRSRVVVADAGKGAIVLLRPWGQEIRAIPSPLGTTRIHHITELPDGRYLLAANHEGHRLHIVNRDLTAVTDRLMPADPLPADPGRASMLDDGRIAYVAADFDGIIPLLSRFPEGWIATDTLRVPEAGASRLKGLVKRGDGTLLLAREDGILRIDAITADASQARTLAADTTRWGRPGALRLHDALGDSLLYWTDHREGAMIRVLRTAGRTRTGTGF